MEFCINKVLTIYCKFVTIGNENNNVRRNASCRPLG